MSSTTIDFGIDLGTTNSAVASLRGKEPQIIKNNNAQDITPSAVAIRKNARNGDITTYVGVQAKNAYIQNHEVALEFKRDMDKKDRVYPFKKAGVERTPVELSAEILKTLRGDVQRVTGEEIDAVVITVPAVFPQPANEATKRAAELAGFRQVLTIQEPVAAATVYGYQKKITETQYWLVFDFGGGTFDAALLKASKGVFSTQNHRGDNFLGGADIDWAILEQMVIPQLTSDYTLPGFKRGAAKWEYPMRLLKHAIEQAKITLSGQETADLQGPVFVDADGAEVDYTTISLSRADVAKAARPLIDKAVSLCKELLAESKIKPADLAKVILVGGPTQAPYFREILKKYFGDILDYSHDPMTVVAKGAAIFASQKLRETGGGGDPEPAAAGALKIEWLNYNPIGTSENPMVAGKVSSPGVQDFSGYRINFVNRDTGEGSGATGCGADGAFIATLHAREGERNFFAIELQDPQGLRKKTDPTEIHYTVSAPIARPTVINSLGVALADNTVEIAFRKGDALPQKKKHLRQSAGGVFHTTSPIAAGDKNTSMRITVVEGEQKRADLNRAIGEIVIDGAMVQGDVAVGTAVEIYVRMDEDRSLFLTILIPDVDLRIMDKRLSLETVEIDPGELCKKYNSHLERAKDVVRILKSDSATDASDPLLNEVDGWESSKEHKEIEGRLDAAEGRGEGWTVAAAQAEQLIREFMGKVFELEERAELLRLNEMIDVAEKHLMAIGQMLPQHMRVRFQEMIEQGRDLLNAIRKQAAKDLAQTKEAIRDGIEKVKQLIVPVLQFVMAIPHFKYLCDKESEVADVNKAAYRKAMENGMAAINAGGLEALARVNAQMMSLLPKEGGGGVI